MDSQRRVELFLMKSLRLTLSTSSWSSMFAVSSSLGILGARTGYFSGDTISFLNSPEAFAEGGFDSSPCALPIYECDTLLYSLAFKGFSKSRDLSKTGSLTSS